MTRHRFPATIEAARGGGAVALIPQDVAAALGGLKQLRVTGTLNGTALRSSTMPYQGAFYLGVHKATREAAGVNMGDEVEIALMRDDSPRVLELPPEFEAAFAEEPALRQRFEALSLSRRHDLAGPISDAKKPETRSKRLEKALAGLSTAHLAARAPVRHAGLLALACAANERPTPPAGPIGAAVDP
ncbi:MAG: YdeI/OmpD-associated family protein [Chloroflexota bacterium]